MSFITRSRLVQIGTGLPDAPQLLTTPVVFRTSGQGVAVETVTEAMALVPAGQRPQPGDWWQYVVEWEVSAHTIPTVRGVIPYTLADKIVLLVVDADFWLTAADQSNAVPPMIRNTFVFGFNQRPRDYAATVRATVDDYLIRATWHNWSGDQRDPRIVASQNAVDDPRGLLTAVAALDGVARTLAGVWRQG